LGTLLGLGFAESAVRLFVPRYVEAANSIYDADAVRLRKRRPDARRHARHPDSSDVHSLIHNALGMRQHRTVTVEPAAEEIRIGVFGDSFTENVGLPVAYSLSEILDYLLRQQTDRVTVLNFGVDSYGMDQSYLSYLHSPPAAYLDQIVYVFCANDIRNLYENKLYDLAEDGGLVPLAIPPRPWWIPLASRLTLSYLVRDVAASFLGQPWGDERPLSEHVVQRMIRRSQQHRLWDPVADGIQFGIDNDVTTRASERYLELAQVVVDHWAKEAVARQDGFRIVLLPYAAESRMAIHFSPHRVLDLYREFSVYAFSETDWTFVNDAHWNELGNLLAAIHIYRDLAAALPGRILTDGDIRRAVYAYYRAFDGWQPPIWAEPWDVPTDELTAIRERYLELE